MFIRVGKVGNLGSFNNGGTPSKGTLLYIIIQKVSNYIGDPSQFQLIDSDDYDLLDSDNNNLWVGKDSFNFDSENQLNNYLNNNFNSDSDLENYEVKVKTDSGEIIKTTNLNSYGLCELDSLSAYERVILEITGPDSFSKTKEIWISKNNNCVFFFI